MLLRRREQLNTKNLKMAKTAFSTKIQPCFQIGETAIRVPFSIVGPPYHVSVSKFSIKTGLPPSLNPSCFVVNFKLEDSPISNWTTPPYDVGLGRSTDFRSGTIQRLQKWGVPRVNATNCGAAVGWDLGLGVCISFCHRQFQKCVAVQ